MKKYSFKVLTVLTITLFTDIPVGNSQVVYTQGKELENEKSFKMNRMIDGGDNSFYCYRVQLDPAGERGFFIEKYSKADLSIIFSENINTREDAIGARIDDVQFAAGTIFIFRQRYIKEEQKMVLFFQTVSSTGIVSKAMQEIISISSTHYEIVNFDFFLNPGKTKFLIKATHKRHPDDTYKTDFIILDAMNLNKAAAGRVMQNLRSPGKQLIAHYGSFYDHDYGFLGLYFDDNDKIYYCATTQVENGADKPKGCSMSFYCLSANSEPVKVDLPIGSNNYVRHVKILKTGTGEIEIAGFFREIAELTDKNLLACGLFSFKTNAAGNTITHKTFALFSDSTLRRLKSTKKNTKDLNYKLDHVITVDNSTYYVGEQYEEKNVRFFEWKYDYRDVIIVKLNANSEFQWVKNIPLSINLKEKYSHIFQQYIVYANSKNLYVLFNDNPFNKKYYVNPNAQPENVTPSDAIHGSDFVCHTINLKHGFSKREPLFRNNTYCFAPIRNRRPEFVLTSDEVLYLPLKSNSVYIYTENRGRDKFDILRFE